VCVCVCVCVSVCVCVCVLCVCVENRIRIRASKPLQPQFRYPVSGAFGSGCAAVISPTLVVAQLLGGASKISGNLAERK
jgi:hypothetical protein